VHRVVLAEAVRFPELGRVFYESGPRVLLQQLAAYLGGLDRDLKIPDPALAAGQFVSLLRGDLHLRMLLGLVKNVEEAEIDRTVANAVELFRRAYAAGA
jgi:TetR/AcrR family transcriptional regulator, mexJK operon transcriptional repressor